MVKIISNLIGNEFWATLVMSFFPLIELKGGIVFARGAGMSFFNAFLLAYLGSTAVFFLIYFLILELCFNSFNSDSVINPGISLIVFEKVIFLLSIISYRISKSI